MRLIVVAYRLSEQNTHYYNELLGYMESARSLGLSARALVPESVTADVAAALHADAVLEPLVEMAPFDVQNPFASLSGYTNQVRNAAPLWSALTQHDPDVNDIVLFTSGQPALIGGIGSWLASRPRQRRPSVFFRIVGDEIIDSLTRPSPFGALFFHLACADLGTRDGQERVFLLGSSPAIVRKASRAGIRRVFPTAIPKHLAFPPDDSSRQPLRPTVYVHVNQRSAPFWGALGDVVRGVRADAADIDFIVKPSGLSADALRLIQSELDGLAEVLPANQDSQDYLANFQRCTIVLLPYEAKPYEVLNSGPFVEALSCDKPVVVPGQTLMAQDVAAGRAAGTIFEQPTVESMVTATRHALATYDDLAAAATMLSSGVRSENSSKRYVQRMIALIEENPDMQPRYQVGEDIDFSDAADSRCFMLAGWGATEAWGVWTVSDRASLSLLVTEERDLVLRADVEPLLTERYPKLTVAVFAAQRQVATWHFDAAAPETAAEQWREAPIRRGDLRGPENALEIAFVIDAPHSPVSQGLSDDARTLGLRFYRLSLA